MASEFVLVNLDRADLERREARGEKSLGPTIRALKIMSSHLSGAHADHSSMTNVELTVLGAVTMFVVLTIVR